MLNMTITPDIQLMITDLSRQLQVPELDVIRQAIESYALKIKKKQQLMSFAGILTEAEADDLLHVIQTSRVNKDKAIPI